jgi:hypothetical protein
MFIARSLFREILHRSVLLRRAHTSEHNHVYFSLSISSSQAAYLCSKFLHEQQRCRDAGNRP